MLSRSNSRTFVPIGISGQATLAAVVVLAVDARGAVHGLAASTRAAISARMASGSAASPWLSIHSTISPLGGSPGRRIILTVTSGFRLFSFAAIAPPNRSPVGSLSVKIATTENRNSGCQSVLSMACSPPALHVASKPSPVAASAHFSPPRTDTTLVSASALISAALYSGRVINSGG